MSESKTVPDKNQELASRINQDARQNPQSPYVDKFVGIASGQVVVVADSLREAVEKLREIEPDPAKCCCIEASYDYDQIHEIWTVIQ